MRVRVNGDLLAGILGLWKPRILLQHDLHSEAFCRTALNWQIMMPVCGCLSNLGKVKVKQCCVSRSVELTAVKGVGGGVGWVDEEGDGFIFLH